MWFETLTGFSENTPDQVRENLMVGREQITSKINGRTFHCGQLETPSLGDLRSRLRQLPTPNAQLRLRELVADVQELHRSPENAGSVFQVASQFNLLEMTSPDVTPEAGVGIYEYDRTQGPACAIAAGAGTIFRNYFVMVNGQQGQSAGNQIDCLHDLGAALGNQGNRL